MERGRITASLPTHEEFRGRFQEEFGRLPERYRALREAPDYPVRVSTGPRVLQERTERQAAKRL